MDRGDRGGQRSGCAYLNRKNSPINLIAGAIPGVFPSVSERIQSMFRREPRWAGPSPPGEASFPGANQGICDLAVRASGSHASDFSSQRYPPAVAHLPPSFPSQIRSHVALANPRNPPWRDPKRLDPDPVENGAPQAEGRSNCPSIFAMPWPGSFHAGEKRRCCWAAGDPLVTRRSIPHGLRRIKALGRRGD